MSEKKYLFNNGKPVHVLIPRNAERDIVFAAEELVRVLTKATFSQVITYDFLWKGGNAISIGNTALAQENHIETSLNEVGKQGYKIKTVDGNIFIYAATPMGVLNGVYGFLERVVNYDYFYKDVETYDYVPVLEVPEFDVIDVPDIQERVVSMGYQWFEHSELRRFRMVRYREVFPDVFEGGAYHNCFGYLPPKLYLEKHPEWFSDNIHTMRATQGQLCYTARGNKDAYQEMIDEAAKRMFETLQGVAHNEIVFALNDTWLDFNENCTCEACQAEKEKYGSYSGSVIKFLKAVAEKVEGLLKSCGDARAETFLIVFYAYHQLSKPPVHFIKNEDGSQSYDENGNPNFEYAPELDFGKHLAIVYARSWCNLIKGFYHPDHKKYLNDVIAWNTLGKNGLFLWAYDRYFDQGGTLIPYDSLRGIESLYKFCKEHKVRWLFIENCTQNAAGTAFSFLKGYLHSKLGWKTNLDVKELEIKFFKAMYGSQYEMMYAIYQEMREYSRQQTDQEHFPMQTCSREVFYEIRWSKEKLQDWLDRMKVAEKKCLEVGEYAAAKHIRIEQLYPLGTLVRVFRDAYTKKVFTEMMAELKKNLFEFGFITLGAGEIGWTPKFFQMLGMTQEEIWGISQQKGEQK